MPSLHPYMKLHPWKSVKAFAKSLADGVFYNKDGLVAINKPYGITLRKIPENTEFGNSALYNISNSTDYSISEALPDIAGKLGYEKLNIVKGPAKYMSGITLLAVDEKVEKRVIKAYMRNKAFQKIPTVYWIVTTKTPRDSSGNLRLALTTEKSATGVERPVIKSSWTQNQLNRRDVLLFTAEFKTICNSVSNYSSLIEVGLTTKRNHALQLFAASVLHSPILGDNLYGALIQDVLGKYVNVGIFSELLGKPPKLKPEILKMLHLTSSKQELIPLHVHSKKCFLHRYFKNSDLTIEAPLTPEFQWTCEKLGFDNFQTFNESSNRDTGPEEKGGVLYELLKNKAMA